MKRVTLNFDDHTVAQLDLIAEAKGLPRIDVIREIVEEHVTQRENRYVRLAKFSMSAPIEELRGIGDNV